jgi:hypothetical protein
VARSRGQVPLGLLFLKASGSCDPQTSSSGKLSTAFGTALSRSQGSGPPSSRKDALRNILRGTMRWVPDGYPAAGDYPAIPGEINTALVNAGYGKSVQA